VADSDAEMWFAKSGPQPNRIGLTVELARSLFTGVRVHEFDH